MPNWKRNKRDENEKEICEALDICKINYWKCPPGLGADLLVASCIGNLELVEVKMSKGTMTKREKELKKWSEENGTVYRIFHSAEEVFAAYR